MSTSKDILRRYTDLPSAINIIRHKAITLLPPTTWDDRNDRHMMEAYKRSAKLETVLALCFAECAETYHHWKVFTSGASGVCIEFHTDKLIEALPRSVAYSSMDYRTIKELNPDEIKLKDLPFVKRVGFVDEQEFRVVFTSQKTSFSTKDIQIPLSAIKRVVLNPWLHEELAESVTEMFFKLAGKVDLKVTQSALIDSPSWRRFADGYA
jgi:hypothetical protein